MPHCQNQMRRLPGSRAALCWSTALTLCAAAACASSGGANPARCQSGLPSSALTLNEVLDSADAQLRLEAVWPESAGLVVASLTGPSQQDSTPGTVFAATLPQEDRDRLREVIELVSFLPPAESVRSRAYLVLGDDSGPSIRRVDRLAQCAPELLNRVGMMSRIQDEVRGLDIPGPVVVRVDVLVLPSGVAGDVRIDETSGVTAIDLAVGRALRQATFRPGRVEGMGIRLWASFPVTVRPGA
jgi:TonB family protein